MPMTSSRKRGRPLLGHRRVLRITRDMLTPGHGASPSEPGPPTGEGSRAEAWRGLPDATSLWTEEPLCPTPNSSQLETLS